MRLRILIFFILAIFSCWLMWHTLSYNSSSSQILVSGKFWSDFGGYLPQIRSFSLGNNWPPQYPLFPGEPTRYHFLFFMLVGFLEKAGFRLDFALNLLSAGGFFFLLVMVWLTSRKIFQDERVSWLSIIFFLFNGSFSFLDFIKKHSLSNLIYLRDFPSFAPWNGSQISAFWNLNIYTNQRHLGLSFALGLLLVYILYTRQARGVYLVGFITGLFLVLNQAVFGIALIFVFWFFIINKSLRLPILLSSIGSLPWVYMATFSTPSGFAITPHFGFLTLPPITVLSVAQFWLQNIGFHLVLIPLGFYFSPSKVRILIVPLLAIFLIPNLFKLSVDVINNHKLFNFFMLFGVMFTANFLIKIWDKSLKLKILSVFLFIFLILGGLVDIFPIINDFYYAIPDVKANPDVAYIEKNTPKGAVVLNSTWFYHPASIAGRFIYNGYPYFTWSFGYDQMTREQNTINIYTSVTKMEACKLLKQGNISYVELNPHPESFLKPNWQLWSNQFIPAYTNPETNLKIFSVSDNCQNQ